mgnify:CR=1 FL=1
MSSEMASKGIEAMIKVLQSYKDIWRTQQEWLEFVSSEEFRTKLASELRSVWGHE